MKTSKIIFFSLLSAIGFIILIAFVDIAIKSHNRPEIKVNKQLLPAFTIICANNSNFNLMQGDSSFIETTYMKDSIPPRLNYTIKGDTLVVSDITQSNNTDSYPSIRIFSTDCLKSIILKKSDINVVRLKSAKMTLITDNSSVWFNQDNVMISSFSSLEILAKNHSNINATSFKIDNLSINLQKSEASLAIMAGQINGTLSDSSRVSTRLSGEISLKADKTSMVIINE
jgi:hypothetical protein